MPPLLARPVERWRTPSLGPHKVVLIEVDDRIFECSCMCGAQTWTPWGEAHAVKRAVAHLVVNGVKVPNEWLERVNDG